MTDVSLQTLIAQHKTVVSQLQDSNERAARQAIADAETLSAICAQTLNKDVCTIFTAQTAIDADIKALFQESEKAQQNIEQWAALFSQLNDQLKELGDVSNWANHMSRDVEDIMISLDALEGAKGKTT
eukprot:PhF_6_TR17647/c0_g1_i1/m.26789/K20185/BLOC1S1; biogenesis of lysosome-related organelles complex 1 subunit 1